MFLCSAVNALSVQHLARGCFGEQPGDLRIENADLLIS